MFSTRAAPVMGAAALAAATLPAPHTDRAPQPEPSPAENIQLVEFELVASGGMPIVDSYAPYSVKMSETSGLPPEALPELHKPIFGSFTFGGREVAVVLDEIGENAERLYVDANRNGDLRDDPPVEWRRTERPRRDGKGNYGEFSGSAFIELGVPSQDSAPCPRVEVTFTRLDAAIRASEGIGPNIDRYRNYVRRGTLTFGDQTYVAVLDDQTGLGHFTEHTALRIDRNRNGRFEPRGENLDAHKPFTINGVTYEITDMAPDGSRFTVRRSAAAVPELLPPPVLLPGSPALPFEAQTIDGRALHFPKDFHGKLVLLDFWSTWCGPCIREAPFLRDAYERFHDRGFDIISISIDRADRLDHLKEHIAKLNMTWHNIHDAGHWDGPLIQLYCPSGIPALYLVDGTTGRVIAEGLELREGKLSELLARTLQPLPDPPR